MTPHGNLSIVFRQYCNAFDLVFPVQTELSPSAEMIYALFESKQVRNAMQILFEYNTKQLNYAEKIL